MQSRDANRNQTCRIFQDHELQDPDFLNNSSKFFLQDLAQISY